MTFYLTQHQAIKMFHMRNDRDIDTTKLHKAYVKLMLMSGRQPNIENKWGMMASLIKKVLENKRMSRNNALTNPINFIGDISGSLIKIDDEQRTMINQRRLKVSQ